MTLRRWVHPVVLAAAAVFLAATPLEAYIGPGAGFVLLSSFLVMVTTMVVAVLSLLVLPIRLTIRALGRSRSAKPLVRRLVIVGLDGQDPDLTDRFMRDGKLPNFSKLATGFRFHTRFLEGRATAR